MVQPPKKASEVLIDFTKPLLDLVPKSSNIEELDKLLTVPVGIWNAHSLKFWESSKVDHRKNYLDRIRESQNPGFKAVFDFWENRRLSLYPNELWCFDYKVVRDLIDPSVVQFQAFVRLPESLRWNLPQHWGGDQVTLLH